MATADRISRHADALRARATALIASASRTRWQSRAATSFRHEVDGIARDMRRAADRVDHAADALRRHARTVERELHALQVAASAAAHAATAGTLGVAHAAEHAGHSALHAMGLG
jgi:uncharacterized protein YukE